MSHQIQRTYTAQHFRCSSSRTHGYCDEQDLTCSLAILFSPFFNYARVILGNFFVTNLKKSRQRKCLLSTLDDS